MRATKEIIEGWRESSCEQLNSSKPRWIFLPFFLSANSLRSLFRFVPAMLCAVAAAGDAFLLPRRAREDRPDATSTRGAGERRSLRPRRRKANVALAAEESTPTSTSSSSSSSQYLDALQSLLREVREDGMPFATQGDGGTKAAAGEEEEEEAAWSLSESSAFLSAALGDGGGGDEGVVSVEEARELLLKTGWRRSRGGGRYKTSDKARARTEAAAAALETEGAAREEEEEATTTAVPSPSSLSATLSALGENAGLVAKGGNSSSSLARAVRRCPSLLALSPNQIALAAAFLGSMGLDRSDVAAACSREPRLLGFGVAESMAPVVNFLRSRRVGMRAEDVARLAVSAPTGEFVPEISFLRGEKSENAHNTRKSSPSSLFPLFVSSDPPEPRRSARPLGREVAQAARRLPRAGALLSLLFRFFDYSNNNDEQPAPGQGPPVVALASAPQPPERRGDAFRINKTAPGLQALEFDLLVYLPHRALEGFWADVGAARVEAKKKGR